MQNISAQLRHKRAIQLLAEANTIGETLLAPSDVENLASSPRWDEDVARLNEKRKDGIKQATSIHLAIRTFIKTRYGVENEYFEWVNSINFEKHKNYYTPDNPGSSNDFNNVGWNELRLEIINLMMHIVSEEEEKIKMENLMVDNAPIRYVFFACFILVSMFGIWFAPPETLAIVFAPSYFFIAKIIMSSGISVLLMVFLAKGSWKQVLVGVLFGIIVAMFPFLKTSQTNSTNQVVKKMTKEEKRGVKKDSVHKHAIVERK